jgi:hypothetical protein
MFRLPRESLDRLLSILERKGGTETLRQLSRIYSFQSWEIEEAEALGFLRIETRKPKIGRPSQIARLSKSQPRNFPPSRSLIPSRIKYSHERFAYLTVFESLKGSSRYFGLPGYVESYLKAYPNAKSRVAAYASCSRLLRHPHVFAARQWFYAQLYGEIPLVPFPGYEFEIWEQLEAFGSRRARYRPKLLSCYREQPWI